MRRGASFAPHASANTAMSMHAVLPAAVGSAIARGQSPAPTRFASRFCHGNGLLALGGFSGW